MLIIASKKTQPKSTPVESRVARLRRPCSNQGSTTTWKFPAMRICLGLWMSLPSKRSVTVAKCRKVPPTRRSSIGGRKEAMRAFTCQEGNDPVRKWEGNMRSLEYTCTQSFERDALLQKEERSTRRDAKNFFVVRALEAQRRVTPSVSLSLPTRRRQRRSTWILALRHPHLQDDDAAPSLRRHPTQQHPS